MPIVSIVFGVVLTGISLWGFLGAKTIDFKQNGTALIPAGVGVPLIVLGLAALRENWLKHAMHGAAVFGVLGVLAALGGLISAIVRKGAQRTLEERSGIPTVLMLVLCAAFVGLCVNSFIQARRRRQAAQQAAGTLP